jgi:Nuclease-related domain
MDKVSKTVSMGFHKDDQWARVEIDASHGGRQAGTSAQERARELRRRAPVKAILSRVLGVHTDERAWAIGAAGEKRAARWLAKLPTGWHVFHDIPVGARGANIDHVVIGPGGVFTVNSKKLTRQVVVSPRTVRVAGHRTDYLPIATHEARRAARLLSTALGRAIDVTPILAFEVDELVVRQQPLDVAAVEMRSLTRWLKSHPSTLSEREVIEIASVAHKPATWTALPNFVDAASHACVCGGYFVERRRRSDGAPFLGCSRYPRCRRTKPLNAQCGSGLVLPAAE